MIALPINANPVSVDDVRRARCHVRVRGVAPVATRPPFVAGDHASDITAAPADVPPITTRFISRRYRGLRLRLAEHLASRTLFPPPNHTPVTLSSNLAIESVFASSRVDPDVAPAYALDSVSRTFHGRDLFSPAAAHLALGVALGELGPPIDEDALVRLELPAPEVGGSRIRANHPRGRPLRERRAQPDPRPPRRGRDRAGHARGARRPRQPVLRRRGADLADATAGELILYEDSYRNVAVAVTRGSAASLLGVEEGSELVIAVDAI